MISLCLTLDHMRGQCWATHSTDIQETMQCYLLCLQRCPPIHENHHDGSLFWKKQSQISFKVTAGISRNSHSRRFGWQRRLSFYRISRGFSETGSRGNWIIYCGGHILRLMFCNIPLINMTMYNVVKKLTDESQRYYNM